jgi:hypothetical protein
MNPQLIIVYRIKLSSAEAKSNEQKLVCVMSQKVVLLCLKVLYVSPVGVKSVARPWATLISEASQEKTVVKAS